MAKALYVDDVRLVTTRSQPPRLLVSALGRVTTTGWSNARLEPWVYIAPPADGLQDLDLVATPPAGPAGQVLMPVAADTSFWLPEWCKGVRVHASANSMESLIPGREVSALPVAPDVDGIPMARGPGDNWPWRGDEYWPWVIAPTEGKTLAHLSSIGATTAGESKVSELIGRAARIIRDGDPTDMMYEPERVTVVLARDRNVIVDIRFG